MKNKKQWVVGLLSALLVAANLMCGSQAVPNDDMAPHQQPAMFIVPHTCQGDSGIYFIRPELLVDYAMDSDGNLSDIFVYDTDGVLHHFARGQQNDICVPTERPKEM